MYCSQTPYSLKGCAILGYFLLSNVQTYLEICCYIWVQIKSLEITRTIRPRARVVSTYILIVTRGSYCPYLEQIIMDSKWVRVSHPLTPKSTHSRLYLLPNRIFRKPILYTAKIWVNALNV
jgi:hypothetical protein